MKTITEYAIINAPLTTAPENNQKVRFCSQDLDEILYQLTECGGIDDSNTSIEIYTVDENGEFVEGSDFDSMSNFLKRNMKSSSVHSNMSAHWIKASKIWNEWECSNCHCRWFFLENAPQDVESCPNCHAVMKG